jgi:hypothetical protein
MSSHTREPWYTDPSDPTAIYDREGGLGWPVARTIIPDNLNEPTEFRAEQVAKANARRIVAAITATVGISVDALEEMKPGTLLRLLLQFGKEVDPDLNERLIARFDKED